MQPQTQINPPAGTSSNSYTATDGTPLDPTAVTLAKSIRQVETGGNYNAHGPSGEFGVGQWMPGNFETAASKYGLNPNDKSPINQDKVLYKQLEEQLQAGHSQSQVASWWNSGKYDSTGNVGVNKEGVAYDTPGYVKKVQDAYSKFSGQGGQGNQQLVNPSATSQPTGGMVTPPSDVTPPTTPNIPTEKPSLLSRIGAGATGLLNSIEAPFIGLAATPIQLAAKALGGPDPYAKGVPGLGGTTVPVTDLNLEKKAGDLAQVGSYFVPGSGVLGAAGMGALQGAGSQMSQGASLPQVAVGGAEGAAVGGLAAGATKLAGKGIESVGNVLSGEKVNNFVSGIKDAYSQALNLSAAERGFEARSGKDLAQVLLKHDASLGRYENGTLDASKAIETLQGALNPLNTQATQMLNQGQGIVRDISLPEIAGQVEARIQKMALPQIEKDATIKGMKSMMAAEIRARGETVPPVVADEIKQAFQSSVFKKALSSSDQMQGNAAYMISNEMKTAVEKAIDGTDTEASFKLLNSQRSDLIDAIKRLTKLDGVRTVRGGRLGNMAGGVVGTITGAASGFGIPGALAGDYFGTRAAEFLNNPATKIAIAKGKAKVAGVIPQMLGKASEPTGKAISAVGRGIAKTARGAGLLANLTTK